MKAAVPGKGIEIAIPAKAGIHAIKRSLRSLG
jgi:hypothetical protein